jgi:SAM-dependent methyltransferase
MTLRDAWEAEAGNWLAWARAPGHDSYWRFHRDRFLALLPPPPGPLLDVGCGEGRLPRDLKAIGYDVVGVDGSPTLIGHAREADPEGEYHVADAARLPQADGSFPLVTAFMSLQDVDDLPGSIQELARVLAPGGRACLAVLHPLVSAGQFEERSPETRFIIPGSYLATRRYSDAVERDGLRMSSSSIHRPLQEYFAALEYAGLLVERVVEMPDTTDPPGDRWQRIPLFLHLRAVKPS